MKKTVLFMFALSLALLGQEEFVKGTITADKLVIRAKPGTHYENIGTFTKDTEVVVVSEKDEWLEVRVPENTTAWVAADAIDENGNVLETACDLYSGPAVVFNTFGKAAPGTQLKLTGEASGNWRKVYAPENTTAWVSKSFVKLPDPAIAEAEAKRIAEEKAAEEKAKKEAEEKRIAEEKAAEEKRLAEEKAKKEAEEKRIAEEKAAEEKRIAEEKAAEEKRIAEEKAKKESEEKALKEAEEARIAAEEAKIAEQSKKLEELKSSINGVETEIKDMEETRGGFEKAPSFNGYIMPLGFHATSMASHIIYREHNGKKQALCYLNSPRIDLNDWNGMHVEVSGVLRQPDNWTLPLLNVMKIIIK